MDIEKKVQVLPESPGVYLFKDLKGTIVYIGKAKSLRTRVRSYSQRADEKDIKTRTLMSKIADLDYLVTESEKEALILENNLIKKYKPRYNVKIKDDKNYPYLEVNDRPPGQQRRFPLFRALSLRLSRKKYPQAHLHIVSLEKL
jgi:excinuclease ABC subunit C